MPPRETERRPSRRLVPVLSILAGLIPATAAVHAQSLDGSRESLIRQNLEAQEQGFSYLRTVGDVQEFANLGLLVPVRGSADFELAGDEVSFPVARPEVKTFLDWFGRRYHAGCGEPLVVTSLTRPTSRQPHNASEISVHPTGIALDLRRSDRSSCRQWLEANLLDLEGKGVIEATRERWPAHYHVAVFGPALVRYLGGQPTEPSLDMKVAALADETPSIRIRRHGSYIATRTSYAPITTGRGRGARHRSRATRGTTARATSRPTSHPTPRPKSYRVGRGDNLWRIAHRNGTSVAVIKRANGLRRDSDLKAGQVLSIPGK
jgi:LysM repeat protein